MSSSYHSKLSAKSPRANQRNNAQMDKKSKRKKVVPKLSKSNTDIFKNKAQSTVDITNQKLLDKKLSMR
jgi:U3 small nucleolar ribonucleoprotein component